eukprot:TRINITY_DN31872_c0_g1_i1.p1 TRINITY_DN31872_c0_g1~~TRINITY_DN31872_c0_g1_i1.p1  ORF type:complete len:265 (+),score=82.34 TRINITY_DN31872_c0_g1_i1:32-796(+)
MSEDESEMSDSPIQTEEEETLIPAVPAAKIPPPEPPKKAKGKAAAAKGGAAGGGGGAAAKKRKGSDKGGDDGPPKPKRAKTSFMYFSADIRPKIRAQHPDASFKELGQLVAEAWREATDDEKKTFVEQAGVDKARYQSEKDAVPKKPKKPLTAFMIFSKAKRAEVKKENPEADFGQLGKLLGALWKGLSDEQKVPYQKEADEDKARFATELAQFNLDQSEKDDKSRVAAAPAPVVKEEEPEPDSSSSDDDDDDE